MRIELKEGRYDPMVIIKMRIYYNDNSIYSI